MPARRAPLPVSPPALTVAALSGVRPSVARDWADEVAEVLWRVPEEMANATVRVPSTALARALTLLHGHAPSPVHHLAAVQGTTAHVLAAVRAGFAAFDQTAARAGFDATPIAGAATLDPAARPLCGRRVAARMSTEGLHLLATLTALARCAPHLPGAVMRRHLRALERAVEATCVPLPEDDPPHAYPMLVAAVRHLLLVLVRLGIDVRCRLEGDPDDTPAVPTGPALPVLLAATAPVLMAGTGVPAAGGRWQPTGVPGGADAGRLADHLALLVSLAAEAAPRLERPAVRFRLARAIADGLTDGVRAIGAGVPDAFQPRVRQSDIALLLGLPAAALREQALLLVPWVDAPPLPLVAEPDTLARPHVGGVAVTRSGSTASRRERRR